MMRACDIAEKHNITRGYVDKILRQKGIKTGRRKVKCPHCGKIISRVRSRLRRTATHFCSRQCYFEFIRSGGYTNGAVYQASRQGQRAARKAVSQVFDLQSSNIVHHADGKNSNNTLSNLVVFNSQSDHLRYHRGGHAVPIWGKANLSTGAKSDDMAL